MGAVYTLATETPYEAFCYGGGLFDDGECEKKKSLGESCQNAGGNYDNNYCVTGFCSDTSGVCELRKSGCRSASACIQRAFSSFADAFGTAMPHAYPNKGARNSTVTGTCGDVNADTGAFQGDCNLAAVVDPFSQPFELTGLEVELADGLTLKLTGTVEMDIEPVVDFDQTVPSLKAAVKYKLGNSIVATLVGSKAGKHKIDDEYLLTNGAALCSTPSGTTCAPLKVFSGAMKVGHFNFIFDIGVQLTAYVKGKATASGEFEAASTFTADIEDQVTLEIDPSAKKAKDKVSMVTLDDAAPTLSAEMTTLTATAKASASLAVVLGAEVTVSVNGIGVEFAAQSKLTMEVDASADSDGCIDGRAGATAGIDVGVHLPSMDISGAMFTAVSTGLSGRQARRRLGESEPALKNSRRLTNPQTDFEWAPMDPNDSNGAYCYVNYLDLQESSVDQATAASDQQSIINDYLSFAGCTKSASTCTELINSAANTAYTSCSEGDKDYADVTHSCEPFKTVTTNSKNVCSSSGGSECFAATDTATLRSGAVKPLSELRVGDEIQTADAKGELSFAKVVFLPHKNNSAVTKFVEVETYSGKRVRATSQHLLVACDGTLVCASSVKIGSCLRSIDGDDTVMRIQNTMAEGYQTVVTENEFVVINGLVASPFAMVHWAVHWYYNLHRFLFKYFPSVVTATSVLSANEAVGSAVIYFASVLQSAGI